MRRAPATLVALLTVASGCGGAPPPGALGDPESAPVATASATPAPAPTVVGARDERAKIQRLLELVRGSGMVFIRNGKPYSAADAADHLASKLEASGDAGMTARDFIQRIASFSSQSGEPYLVRLPDGKTMPAREWLLQRLAEIEAAAK